MFASDQSVSDPAGGFEGSFAEVQVFQFDPGNPRNPRDDTSRSFSGFAELAPEQFQASGLDSATLNAEILVCESPGPGPALPPNLNCFSVTIDLAWAGSGDVHNNSGKSNQRVDGCKRHSTFSGSFRDATATGTVSNGSTDFVSGPSDFAGVSTFSFEETLIGDCLFLFPPPPPEP